MRRIAPHPAGQPPRQVFRLDLHVAVETVIGLRQQAVDQVFTAPSMGHGFSESVLLRPEERQRTVFFDSSYCHDRL